jgi:hypothetical protein
MAVYHFVWHTSINILQPGLHGNGKIRLPTENMTEATNAAKMRVWSTMQHRSQLEVAIDSITKVG